MLRRTIETWKAVYWPRRIFALTAITTHTVIATTVVYIPELVTGAMYFGLLATGVPINVISGWMLLMLAAIVSWMIIPDYIQFPHALIVPVSLTFGITMLWWDWHVAHRRIAEDVHT